MFLEDYDLLCRYWTDHPPVQLMVQAYLGIKPRSAEQPRGLQLLP